MKACLFFFCATVFCQIAVASDAAPGAVVLEERGHGWLIRDARNMSLYVTKRDQELGKSTCVEACATKWPPLLAEEDAVGGGDWQVISRDDGSRRPR